MSEQPPVRPELRLVRGEGPEPVVDENPATADERPPLRLVVGSTLPDDLL